MQRMEEMRRQEMMREEQMRRQEQMQKQQMRSMESDPRVMSAGGRSAPQSDSSAAAGQSSVTETKDDGAVIVSRLRLRLLQPDDDCCGKGKGDGDKKKSDDDDWKGKLPDYAKVHIRGPKGRVLTVKVGPYQPVGQLASLPSENSDDSNDEQDDSGSSTAPPGALSGTAVPVMGIPYYQTAMSAQPATKQAALSPMITPQIVSKNKAACACANKPKCSCSSGMSAGGVTPVTSPSNVRRLLLFEKVPQSASVLR